MRIFNVTARIGNEFHHNEKSILFLWNANLDIFEVATGCKGKELRKNK